MTSCLPRLPHSMMYVSFWINPLLTPLHSPPHQKKKTEKEEERSHDHTIDEEKAMDKIFMIKNSQRNRKREEFSQFDTEHLKTNKQTNP